MNYRWIDQINMIGESLDMGDSPSILLKLKSIDSDFFNKWKITNITSEHYPDKVSFGINKNGFDSKIEIYESDSSNGKFDITILDPKNQILIKKSGIFVEDVTRTIDSILNKKQNPIQEYKKGELKAISDQSRANLSNDTKSTSVNYDDNIDDFEESRKDKSKQKKPVGTNTGSIDSIAKAAGSGMSSLRGHPSKMSDFVKHMRDQIPDFDKLVRTSPRFSRMVRQVSPQAERDLKRITNDTD